MDLFHLVSIHLRFLSPTQLHFFHHPAVYAAVLDRLGNPPNWPAGLAIYCPERGRCHYRTGSPYVIGAAVRPASEVSPQRLVQLLSAHPKTRFGQTKGAPFGSNYTLEKAIDLVSGGRLTNSPAAVTLEHVSRLASELAGRTEVTLRFLSPLQIWRWPVQDKNQVMDDHVFEPAKLLDYVIKAVVDWWPELLLPDQLFAESSANNVTLLENRMARTDVAYPKKRLLGSCGSVRLFFKGGVGHWAVPLLLAGVIGAGKRNMGQGRYDIEGFPILPTWPPPPAETILQRATHESILDAARLQMREAGPTPGIDEIDKDTFLDELTYRLPRLKQAIVNGSTVSSPLRGMLIREKSAEADRDKLRPLAIPTFDDRFIQKCIAIEIEPGVEKVLEDSAFAYRKGFSHKLAQKSVDKARSDGYHYLLDADIRSFFDCVDWDLLKIRLNALYGNDPLVDALMKCVMAPVEFSGRVVQRSKGLPQGSVLSPMLANLFLDALDEAVAEAGFRLVRYADDFVVFCKSKDEIQRARQVVTEELKALRLTLNEDKTRETSFDEGFKFLGALFCRSVVLDANRKSREVVAVITSLGSEALDGEDVVGSGWLDDFLAEEAAGAAEDAESAPAPALWRPTILANSSNRKPIYVISKGVKVVGKKTGILVQHEEGRQIHVGWNEVSEVVIMGGKYVSSSVMQRAMKHRIPIAFHQWDGTPLGLVLPNSVRSPSPACYAQWTWSRDQTAALRVAKALVVAKIRNTRMFVRRRREGVQDLVESLRRMQLLAGDCDDCARLRGVEGQAAQAYFGRWESWLSGSDVGPFPRRHGRGSQDPVNIMLNILYSQLFRFTHLAIVSLGLDPYLGVLHQGNGRYAALASDMMEPFRFCVDRVVLSLLNHHQLTSKDFIRSEKGPYPVRLSPEAFRVLLDAYEQLMSKQIADHRDRLDTFKGHINNQLLSFYNVISGLEAEFQPFFVKW